MNRVKLKTYRYDKTLTCGEVSLKIDGVQAIREDGKWISRANKPLYNLPDMPDGVYEVYIYDWNTTVSAVRTHEGTLIPKKHLYMLLPELDDRLLWSSFCTSEAYAYPPYMIKELLGYVVKGGFEGLVIRSIEGDYKVKPVETYDVKIIGIQEGEKKNKGKLGAFITDKGNVGTGFTDLQRKELFNKDLIGEYIEVECMSLTNNGKFRHPRFIRIRFDK